LVLGLAGLVWVMAFGRAQAAPAAEAAPEARAQAWARVARPARSPRAHWAGGACFCCSRWCLVGRSLRHILAISCFISPTDDVRMSDDWQMIAD